MARHDGSRDLWNNSERPAQRQFDPGLGYGPDRNARRSGDRNWFTTIFKLALVVAACAAAWHFGQPLLLRLRSNRDVEDCAVRALRNLPKKVVTEQELADAIGRETHEALTTHHSLSARWFVCFGPRGDGIRVLRNDTFTPSERAFVERLIDEGRLRTDVEGVRNDVFRYPLGATYSTVTVGDKPWCVAVGWSEKL